MQASLQPELQRTRQWFRDREGRLTGSTFGAACGIAPTSRAEQWRRLTKRTFFEGNAATDHGEKYEPEAIKAYERETGSQVELVGFIPHPRYDWLGASPDGLVGKPGMLEVKCPYIDIYHAVPPYYMCQMQGQMEVCDREWVDFIVWTEDGGTIQRVVRSEKYWRWMEPRLAEFWSYVVADVCPPRLKRKEYPDDSGLVISTKYFLNPVTLH